MLIFLQTERWIYIHPTFVICWVECRLVYNWRFCSQDQNYILYLHSTQQVDALHHPRSPLVVKYIPDIYVKNEGLTDILWKAGVACYRILVAHCRGGYTGRQYKKRYSLLRKIRLTSYVGLNAGIVYNSDPTSRISNYMTNDRSAERFMIRFRTLCRFPRTTQQKIFLIQQPQEMQAWKPSTE